MNRSLFALAALGSLAVFASASAQEPQPPEGLVVTPERAHIYGLFKGRVFRSNFVDPADDTAYLDLDLFEQSLRDALSEPASALTPARKEAGLAAYTAFNAAIREKELADREALSASNRAAGQAWIVGLREQSGIVETQSGLLYKIIEPANGERPTETSMVRFSYEERTIDGTLIDQSPPGVAETFAVRHLIAGLREGVQLMPAGSTYEFYLLPDLAFGPLAAHNIGPGNALQFTITLEEVD